MKNKEQIAKIWDVLDSLNVDVLQNKKDISRIDEVLSVSNLYEPQEPKPKQLDQSVFDGLDARWLFAAVDADGCVWAYREEPKVDKGDDRWSPSNRVPTKISCEYDTTDWQDSLIERDKVELTGSDLCRAMLERGDKFILCSVDDRSDNDAINDLEIQVVGYISNREFVTQTDGWKYAVPINNQGEPLTASEVGL